MMKNNKEYQKLIERPMESNYYSKICSSLTSLIKNWGDNYRILSLEGHKNGNTVKSIIVEVSGQNYLQVESAPIVSQFELFPQSKHQKAIYHCSPYNDGQYSLFKEGKEIISKSEFSYEALINEVFGDGDIDIKLQKKQEVAKLLGKLMNRCILPNRLAYDVYKQSYHFLDWDETNGAEYLWFSNYFHDLKTFVDKPFPFDNYHVAKYTSLDTALMMLNSKKMRMMSVSAMNDKLEIGHLYGELCNDEASYMEDKTKINSARHRYITSFTNKIDDLTMWRLYGDDAKGVCLVFAEPYECHYYFPMDYSGKDSEICHRAKKICEELYKRGIKFTFKSLESIWQYFLKPEGFRDEQELRYLRIDNSKPDGYLVSSNGVISSYNDYLLLSDEDNLDNVFPASLECIILGPNMKNTEINRFQLEALASEKGFPLLMGVRPSTIKYYL